MGTCTYFAYDLRDSHVARPFVVVADQNRKQENGKKRSGHVRQSLSWYHRHYKHLDEGFVISSAISCSWFV